MVKIGEGGAAWRARSIISFTEAESSTNAKE